MSFQIENKVALISGGASGLGLKFAKELLKNGLRGVTLADVNEEYGKEALEDIQKEFGPNKAIFVPTDVTNKSNYEEAFKKTIETFKNLDILINNAGVLNDSIWEREIAINIIGTVHGILLGLDNYIPKHKTSTEGVILNLSSVAGLGPSASFPLYAATKHAVLGMSTSFGDDLHYKRTNVKVLTLCPGPTETPMMTEAYGRTLGPVYETELNRVLKKATLQKIESVASAIIPIIKNAKSGTVWVASKDKEPYQYMRNFALN